MVQFSLCGKPSHYRHALSKVIRVGLGNQRGKEMNHRRSHLWFPFLSSGKEILEKGELQVSGKERGAQLSVQFRDIATIVMEKTIDPETRCPYTMNMIEHLMHDIHFTVDPNITSKEQEQKGVADG
ncbi:ribosome maturation protein SBDS isoform X1 [Triticum aestivum]|uniref:ribosome maturation protein SBDS isoform X1 n=1 Tax=Triticum aestivum TaxID=4565 RepID=UPI001D02D79E|nr:ribosome maturation protein SBDS-like isoform X1 [Triticum aestivum]